MSDTHNRSDYGEEIKSHDNQLHGLMKSCQFDLVKSLLEKLSPEQKEEAINSKDHTGHTLLMHAVIRNDSDAVTWLLKYGANIADKNLKDKDALTIAQCRDRASIVDIINKVLSEHK